MYRFLLIPLLLWPLCSFAKGRVSFDQMMQQLLKTNDSVLQGQAQIARSGLQDRTSRLLNIPTIAGGFTQKQNDISQVGSTPIEISQKIQNATIGVNGVLPRYGINYELSYLKTNQRQSAYSIVPSISEAGETLVGQIDVNLLEDAGYLVGNIPFDLRTANNTATRAGYNITLQSSLLTLINLYTAVINLQQKITITSKIEDDALRLMNSYKALYREGKISKVDLLSAQIQLKQQKVAIEALEIQLRESKRQLIYYTGGKISSGIEENLSFEPFSVDLEPFTRKKTDIGRGNPDIANLDTLTALTDLQVESLDNKLLPTLKFSVGYTDANNPLTDNILTNDQNTINSWFATINLSIPLDNLAARTDLRLKEIERENFKRRREVLSNSVPIRLDGLSAEVTQTLSQLKITEEVEALSKQRFKSTIPLVKSNAQARIDIFTFQNQLIQTQYDLIDYEFALIRKRAEILYVKGTLYNSLTAALR